MASEWPTPKHPHLSTAEVLNMLVLDVAEEAGMPNSAQWAEMLTGTLISLMRDVRDEEVSE